MKLVSLIWNFIRDVLSGNPYKEWRENYLAQSTDHADLENRLRFLERYDQMGRGWH